MTWSAKSKLILLENFSSRTSHESSRDPVLGHVELWRDLVHVEDELRAHPPREHGAKIRKSGSVLTSMTA